MEMKIAIAIAMETLHMPLCAALLLIYLFFSLSFYIFFNFIFMT